MNLFCTFSCFASGDNNRPTWRSLISSMQMVMAAGRQHLLLWMPDRHMSVLLLARQHSRTSASVRPPPPPPASGPSSQSVPMTTHAPPAQFFFCASPVASAGTVPAISKIGGPRPLSSRADCGEDLVLDARVPVFIQLLAETRGQGNGLLPCSCGQSACRQSAQTLCQPTALAHPLSPFLNLTSGPPEQSEGTQLRQRESDRCGAAI